MCLFLDSGGSHFHRRPMLSLILIIVKLLPWLLFYTNWKLFGTHCFAQEDSNTFFIHLVVNEQIQCFQAEATSKVTPDYPNWMSGHGAVSQHWMKNQVLYIAQDVVNTLRTCSFRWRGTDLIFLFGTFHAQNPLIIVEVDLHQGFLSCFKVHSAGRDNCSKMTP